VAKAVKLRWTDPGPKVLKSSVRGLQESDVSAVFQPIVSLADGSTFAHEALARCHDPRFPTPIALFTRAEQENACGRIGRLVRNVIFEHCSRQPVFVNLHPQELHQRWLVQPTDPLFVHEAPIYLEVTESAALQHYDVCANVLAEVCGRSNARLVVDDLGAGHSDMDRVLLLRPQMVKLDMSLVRDIDQEPVRQREVLGIVERCHELGARVVAEGIQGMDELMAIRDLGVEFGQGYLFGRPQRWLDAGWWPLTTNPFSTKPPSDFTL
jgi:EAL domain-containing protein (putative c-di-GMP-specific phosphodiesterase class I)